MAVLGIDIGGTKACFAVFTADGELLKRETILVQGGRGDEIGDRIIVKVKEILTGEHQIRAIGACVPGIYRKESGTVWAPNIPGWEDFPLLRKLQEAAPGVPVAVDSDRACYILGEVWKGKARNHRHAIFLAVGTGIGAGILVDGNILRGANDIAGAIGWMALDRPFESKYTGCGCFEHNASGEGIAKICKEMLEADPGYEGALRSIPTERLRSSDVFESYEAGDPLAILVFDKCIEYWGMATANLVSLFNPSIIIYGGGVFGPAGRFLDRIRGEALKWAQPISMGKVSLEISALGGDAGVYGAAHLAIQNLKTSYNA